MSAIPLWIGVLIFGLGAIFSLLSAVRTLQKSRRWSDYRLRRRYIVQARGSIVLAGFSGALAFALLMFGRLLGPGAIPALPPPTASPVPSQTASITLAAPATETPFPTETLPAASLTPSPIPFSPTAVIPPTVEKSPTPAMPIAVQALVQGTVTPAFDVQFGRLRFSTEINNYTLVAPGEKFSNPIKQMYSVFTYQPVGVKVEWTALWYQNGELRYVDTTSWQDFPPGVAVAKWLRPAPEWEPGDYEVQVFLGTDWKATGRFALEGEPSTVTASPPPTETSSPAPSATSSLIPTTTATATVSPTSLPTKTPRPTLTLTPASSSTATALPSATTRSTETARPSPSSTPAPPPTKTPIPTVIHTSTPAPSRTPTASATSTRVPSRTPSPTTSPTSTATLPPVKITVYFTNTRPSGPRRPPFNEGVTREIPGSATAINAALDAYFTGPSLEEQSRGLVAVRNGFVGYRRVDFADGVVSIYLAGNCRPLGNGYSLAQPLIATLRQFPGVLHVKIYDAYDHTGDALNKADSWPLCLDVIFTNTPTPAPTSTNTPLPTSTPRPTQTPLPTATFTASPSPTATATRPSATPLPTLTSTTTPQPSLTPTVTASRTPSASPTASRTRTPTITFTPGPTNTPRPTLTLTPINAPTRTGLATAPPSPTPVGFESPLPTLDTACNHAEFLGDVTIVDNATLRPGEAFRKTWRIQNLGECPWTAAYSLVFARGERMGGPATMPLPALVLPGQSADVSLDLAAPRTPGQYEGYWQLQTPNKALFGLGPAATGHLWVKIRVAGEPVPASPTPSGSPGPSPTRPTAWAEATLTAFVGTSTAEAALLAPSATPRLLPTPSVEMDLVARACEAQWQANEGILACPGTDGDARGAVIPLAAATLEGDKQIDQPTLLTVPSSSQDGYVLGLYPRYMVQPGDRLQATVGCEQAASQCSVLFRVSYLDSAGAAHDLWTLGEFHDGHAYDLDLDLNDLAGQQVRFVLSVSDLGSAQGDRALWVSPRIVHRAAPLTSSPAPSPTPVVGATATLRPTATALPPSPTASVPTPTPAAPIPQFFESIIEFFRQLFGVR